jgi:site-specific recombinase XerD
MSAELVPIPRRDLTRAGFESLPAAIGRAGEPAAWRFIEFFAAMIRNRNTRAAYANAILQFFAWSESHHVKTLESIKPVVIAAYIENHPMAAPTVKQHLAAIRMLFDFLVTGQVIPMNPAASVRGPKHVVKRGKTPVLTADQARTLLKWHEVPAHHNAEAYLDAYLEAAGIRAEKKSWLFRSFDKQRKITANGMSRTDVLRMVKRRALEAGLPSSTCCHTFRATGITAYLENGGTIENAQVIAAHESPRTTKLYDRTSDEITLDEVERIGI